MRTRPPPILSAEPGASISAEEERDPGGAKSQSKGEGGERGGQRREAAGEGEEERGREVDRLTRHLPALATPPPPPYESICRKKLRNLNQS